jgi:hypothetical protein
MQHLDRKPERKRPLERHRCTWEDNIKMDLKERGCGMNSSVLAPLKVGIFLTE